MRHTFFYYSVKFQITQKLFLNFNYFSSSDLLVSFH